MLEHPFSNLSLFGSRAQGTARNDSDLYPAVICQESELDSRQRTQRWRFYREALGQQDSGIDWCCKDNLKPQDWPAPAGM